MQVDRMAGGVPSSAAGLWIASGEIEHVSDELSRKLGRAIKSRRHCEKGVVRRIRARRSRHSVERHCVLRGGYDDVPVAETAKEHGRARTARGHRLEVHVVVRLDPRLDLPLVRQGWREGA